MTLEAGLYLIPTQLSDVALDRVLPAHNIEVVRGISHFVVESLRSARRFLKKCDRDIDIDSLTMNELNEHTDLKDTDALEGLLDPIGRGEAVGVISDAGCPAVAERIDEALDAEAAVKPAITDAPALFATPCTSSLPI